MRQGRAENQSWGDERRRRQECLERKVGDKRVREQSLADMSNVQWEWEEEATHQKEKEVRHCEGGVT